MLHLQDPDHGPLMVGDACQRVNSVSVPKQTMLWTCGISVQGDYACGGGAPAFLHVDCTAVDCEGLFMSAWHSGGPALSPDLGTGPLLHTTYRRHLCNISDGRRCTALQVG